MIIISAASIIKMSRQDGFYLIINKWVSETKWNAIVEAIEPSIYEIVSITNMILKASALSGNNVSS